MLTIDGPASRSTLEFPRLATVGTVFFKGCQLEGGDFPALQVASQVTLACELLEPPFVFRAELLETLPSLVVGVAATLDVPALRRVDDLLLQNVGIDDLFAEDSGLVSVNHMRVEISDLSDVRVSHVSDVDTLELVATRGDLRLDGFPDLGRIRILRIEGYTEIHDCTLSAFIDQLGQPPEMVDLQNTTLTPCN